MEPISMLIAAGIAAVAYGAGRSSRPRRRSAPSDPTEPICRCTHSLAFHDPTTGTCHAMIRDQPITFNSFEQAVAWSKVQCSCRQYVGPASTEQILASFTPPPPAVERPVTPSPQTETGETEKTAD